MSSHQKSTHEPSYTVDVNPEVAFTINYNDNHGRLVFGIEVGDDPNLIFLNPRPSDGSRMVEAPEGPTKARIGLAVKRVVEYFNAKGLRVELD